MPPRARRTSKKLSLGFAGGGQLDKKATVALLDDLIDGESVEVVYVPVTQNDYTDEIAGVVAWCKDNDIAYHTVSDEAAGKDRTLKKVIAEGESDFDAGENASHAIVELLTSTEDDPVADGRLLMFFNGDDDIDVATAEEAEEAEVAAFDLCDALSPIEFGDGDKEPEPEPEPEEEKPRRGRGRAAAAEEPEEEEEKPRGRRGRSSEPEKDMGAGDGQGGYTKAEQKKFDAWTSRDTTLTELKKLVKALGGYTTDDLSGVDKAYCANILIEAARKPADEPEGDEGQQEATSSRRGRSRAAAEPEDAPEGDDEDQDPKDAVFARLRATREVSQHSAETMTAALKVIEEQADETEDALQFYAYVRAACDLKLMEHVIVEVRKPKSAGRPRKDGTEAQPKEAAEETPRRGRGRSRS